MTKEPEQPGQTIFWAALGKRAGVGKPEPAPPVVKPALDGETEQTARNVQIDTSPTRTPRESRWDVRIGSLARKRMSPAEHVTARELSPDVPVEPEFDVPRAPEGSAPWSSAVDVDEAPGLSPAVPREPKAVPPVNPRLPDAPDAGSPWRPRRK